MEFIDYIENRLTNNGYRCTRPRPNSGDLFVAVEGARTAWVCYLDAPIEPEDIRKALQYPGYLLFVVNEKLIPDDIESREATPMWLRVLHGLYMGRIYTWNGRHLFGLHFDYDTGDVSESSIIDPTDLLLVETGTWLRGWTDIYRLARFYDRAWWVDNGWQRFYERAQQERARQQQQKPPPYEPPRQDAQRDFLAEFKRCGTLVQAKILFRQLAKEYHPDLSGRDTTAEMQQINRAWEQAQRVMV